MLLLNEYLHTGRSKKMSLNGQNSEIAFFFSLVINANTIGRLLVVSLAVLSTSSLMIFHVELDDHWETTLYVTISFMHMQDFIHKMAKASVLWISQSRIPQAEAVGIRGEFTACK